MGASIKDVRPRRWRRCWKIWKIEDIYCYLLMNSLLNRFSFNNSSPVTGIPSAIVYILGGNKYSNVLYGQDAKGQFIKFIISEDTSYSILSQHMMKDEMNDTKGFVASKSYNRTSLLYRRVKDDFSIDGQNYTSENSNY